jgi:hypothetical protein
LTGQHGDHRGKIARRLHQGQIVDAVRERAELDARAVDTEGRAREVGPVRDVALRGVVLVRDRRNGRTDEVDLSRVRQLLDDLDREPRANRAILGEAADNGAAEVLDRVQDLVRHVRPDVDQRLAVRVDLDARPERADSLGDGAALTLLHLEQELGIDPSLCRRPRCLLVQQGLDLLQGLRPDLRLLRRRRLREQGKREHPPRDHCRCMTAPWPRGCTRAPTWPRDSQVQFRAHGLVPRPPRSGRMV